MLQIATSEERNHRRKGKTRFKRSWISPQLHRRLRGRKGLCRRDGLDEILGEIMLGMELLSVSTGLSNATQGWRGGTGWQGGDRLAADAAETPLVSSSWSWTARPRGQPHSTVPRSRVSALQALVTAPGWFTYRLLRRSLHLWQTGTPLFLYHCSSPKAGGDHMSPTLAL